MDTKFHVYIYDWDNWHSTSNGRRIHRVATLHYSFDTWDFRDALDEATRRAVKWLLQNGFSAAEIRDFEYHIREAGDPVCSVRYADKRPALIPA